MVQVHTAPTMNDLPAVRLMRGEHTPADLAEHDQVRAAASADLDTLLDAYRAARVERGLAAANTAYVIGLMNKWPPLHVAAALVEALERIVNPGDAG